MLYNSDRGLINNMSAIITESKAEEEHADTHSTGSFAAEAETLEQTLAENSNSKKSK